MDDLTRFVTELQAHGVTFWLEPDGTLRWHSMAALTLKQVIEISKHRQAISDIVRGQQKEAA